ncbi:hypothetical protein CTAYLR_010593 [Chrysophaeum taylorii]|uniref:ubiquitinyl hydrolase 1 n=1 Tax=Chrysophaeum taylorii TaxID=2483200 RepID=A0AAD7XNI9_9STRA|nr:hypothetical protein CTAYLR_010593 [Chrysophaeum taylorii]
MMRRVEFVAAVRPEAGGLPAAPPGARPGLRNGGNTCYLNAVVQCLAHLPLRLEVPLRAEKPFVAAALRDVIRRRDPAALIARLADMGFSRTQHDAHEFLRALVDAAGDGFTPNPFEVFGGVLASTLLCPCGHQSRSLEPFHDLSVEPRNTVDESLRSFLASETLDRENSWFCEKCRRRVRAVKTLRISKAPEVLVIHLKRYSGRGKIDRHVAFAGGVRDYALRAVLVHDGRTAVSGHYASFCRDQQEGAWYLFDDERVARVDENTVFSQQAYILFYVKKKQQQRPARPFFHAKRRRRWILIVPTCRRRRRESHGEVEAEDPRDQDEDAPPPPTKSPFHAAPYDYWDAALDKPRLSKKLKKF